MSLRSFLTPSIAKGVFCALLLVISGVLLGIWFGTNCNELTVLASHARAGDQCKVVTAALVIIAWPFPVMLVVLDALHLGQVMTSIIAALPVLAWFCCVACMLDWLREKIPEN